LSSRYWDADNRKLLAKKRISNQVRSQAQTLCVRRHNTDFEREGAALYAAGSKEKGIAPSVEQTVHESER
jgi:hypothetical protein